MCPPSTLDDSTARRLTLPTGGAPVTLANGLPLYGNNPDAPEKGRPGGAETTKDEL